MLSYLMGILSISFLFSLVLLLPHTSTTPVCEEIYCGSPALELAIEFPFHLRGANNQSDRCGYPGFEILCNKRKQALLTLPNGGDFVVKAISHERQRVWINDPEGCLPRRFLRNIDLTGSPFEWDSAYNPVNLIFLNCSNITFNPQQHIPCLSNGNDEYSIISMLSQTTETWDSSCRVIGYALAPIKDSRSDLIWGELYSDLVLQWNIPNCRYCEVDHQCGFLTDTGLDVTCYYNHNFPGQGRNPSTPISRSVKYMPLSLGISVLLLLIWIAFLSVRAVNSNGEQRQTSIEPNIRRPPVIAVGLDGSAIEQYPKIQLGESGELPKSIDNVCCICLSEYEPKETLRTMPQCNHYFHADCIDAWLKMNATCPLCRNLPKGSALVISLPRSTESTYHSSS